MKKTTNRNNGGRRASTSSWCWPLAILACALSLMAVACSSRTPLKGGQPRNPHDLMETRDMNGDHRIDSWLYYDGKGDERKVVKRRTDLNFDGKVDITQHFQAGVLSLEELDLDYDGQIDLRSFYDAGIVQRSELDLGFDGRVDLWRYFENGVLVRKERDTNADGKVDQWEYFEGGKVIRIGRDVNHDGTVDIWE